MEKYKTQFKIEVVKPGHLFQGGQFHRFFGFPRCATVDQLGLVRPLIVSARGVVVAVALAAHRGRDAGLGQSVAVADADVLRPPVRVVNQCPVPLGMPGVQRLLQTRPARSLRASNC